MTSAINDFLNKALKSVTHTLSPTFDPLPLGELLACSRTRLSRSLPKSPSDKRPEQNASMLVTARLWAWHRAVPHETQYPVIARSHPALLHANDLHRYFRERVAGLNPCVCFRKPRALLVLQISTGEVGERWVISRHRSEKGLHAFLVINASASSAALVCCGYC